MALPRDSDDFFYHMLCNPFPLKSREDPKGMNDQYLTV